MRASAILVLLLAAGCDSGPVDLSAENAAIEWGEYRIENNWWGKSLAIGDHSQSIFLRATDGEVVFGWDWSWVGTGVVAYPNVFFGDSPFDQTRTTRALPMRVGSRRITARFEMLTEATGTWNTSFDLFFTATPTGRRTHEVMIWTDGQRMSPAGEIVGEVEVGGTVYDVFWEPEMDLAEYGWPQPFVYAAYLAREPVRTGPLDIGAFLDDLVARGYLTEDHYLACIGFGNEVVLGRGHTEVRGYAIELE
jgi:hypothetical protein